MVEPTIIANYGDGDLGKTKSVILAYEKLRKIADKDKDGNVKEETICKPEDLNEDICYILTINNVKVGISSQGDPRSAQKWLLEELVNKGCQIILATCRHYGATTDAILVYYPDYRIYWTSNARLYEYKTYPRVAPKGIQSRFNDNWATEIANLIEAWCYAGKEKESD